MNEPIWTHGVPKTVLLATDLSSRCDRALDRAAQLAKQWDARLIVLHVAVPQPDLLDPRWEPQPSWRRPADRRTTALEQIRRDLIEDLPDVEVVIEEGEPAVRIQEVAARVEAGLIVTGVARDETFGRLFVGSTVIRLSRQSHVPVLVVKTRPRRYGEILVATDFSESSRHALNAAATYFPSATLTLLHAYEVPFSGLMQRTDFEASLGTLEKGAYDQFLQDLAPEVRRRIRPLIEHGSPAMMIRRYMHDRNVDLVVLGSHGRSATFEVFIGSVAKQVLESAPGDVLLVRDPRSVSA